MPSFTRLFAFDVLAEWDAKNSGNAVRTLFNHWCLPGETATGDALLRLGLRDGYLSGIRNGIREGKFTFMDFVGALQVRSNQEKS